MSLRVAWRGFDGDVDRDACTEVEEVHGFAFAVGRAGLRRVDASESVGCIDPDVDGTRATFAGDDVVGGGNAAHDRCPNLRHRASALRKRRDRCRRRYCDARRLLRCFPAPVVRARRWPHETVVHAAAGEDERLSGWRGGECRRATWREVRLVSRAGKRHLGQVRSDIRDTGPVHRQAAATIGRLVADGLGEAERADVVRDLQNPRKKHTIRRARRRNRRAERMAGPAAARDEHPECRSDHQPPNGTCSHERIMAPTWRCWANAERLRVQGFCATGRGGTRLQA
jgi:hypothetical protein